MSIYGLRHVDGQTPRQALHELEAATNSFVVPLSPKLFMVAVDTEAKRKDLEQTEVVSVPMPSVISPQAMAELGQAIKQSVGVEKMYWDPHANEVVLKDRVSRADAAQAVLQRLTAYRAEVAMELQFLELDETDMLVDIRATGQAERGSMVRNHFHERERYGDDVFREDQDAPHQYDCVDRRAEGNLPRGREVSDHHGPVHRNVGPVDLNSFFAGSVNHV